MKAKSRVLGIDPGLARMGWAMVEQASGRTKLIGCGCLETASHQPDGDRLLALYRQLGKIISRYRPNQVAVEKLYFTTNVSTAMTVGQARGMVLLSAADHRLPVTEFTPTGVKQSVTGDGRADKRQVQRMIKILLHLNRLPRHDDTSDAIAIALCGVVTNNYLV